MVTDIAGPKSSVATTELIQEIVTWLRARFDESKAQRFVLGLSGGIDSAVVCALCARAAGPDRVLGVIMPSSSNPDDAQSASLVATAFKVPTVSVDLTDVTERFYGAMPDQAALTGLLGAGKGEMWLDAQHLATANVRPRLRMTTLYYLANLCGGLVVGTGNKSEASVGYFTKYGDGGVDLFPIIDLYKFEVRAIARELGVPQSVIDRPPSAGLWQDQTDEEELGISYDELDEVLLAMERGDTSGLNEATVERIATMNRVSEHKRQPVPAYARNVSK